MLSAIKTAFVQPSRLSCRRLATASFEHASASDAAALASLPSTGEKGITESLPMTRRVSVPLTSLIRPSTSEIPPKVELDPTVFAHPIRRDILHSCVVHILDGLRQGSANTKTRAEVRGSGRKIRRQKGSGMARLGDGQSPMLRGGGVAFGPKPRSFATKLPRKVIQMGMRVALSARLKENALKVVQSLDWPGVKTRDMAARLQELGWRKTLFVTGREEIPSGLDRSTSNLYRVEAITVEELNVYDLVKWPHVVLDMEAVELLQQKLSKLPGGMADNS